MLPARTEWTFYAEDPAKAAALQAGSIDCIDQFTLATGPQLLNGNVTVIALKASSHRELSMRTDIAPFTSKYVRQAIAYMLDRPATVTALFKGYAEAGSDSPFAPAFRATDPSVPQRTQNLKLATTARRCSGNRTGWTGR